MSPNPPRVRFTTSLPMAVANPPPPTPHGVTAETVVMIVATRAALTEETATVAPAAIAAVATGINHPTEMMRINWGTAYGKRNEPTIETTQKAKAYSLAYLHLLQRYKAQARIATHCA